jgi:hypothetical protein
MSGLEIVSCALQNADDMSDHIIWISKLYLTMEIVFSADGACTFSAFQFCFSWADPIPVQLAVHLISCGLDWV